MVSFAGVFGAALGSLYEDATLHRPAVPAYSPGGAITAGSPSSFPCKAQIDSATTAMRADTGFVSTDMRLLVLTISCPTRPNTDDQVAILTGPWAGTRWSIQSRGTDPANGAWEMRGRQL